LADRLRRRS
jgi:4,5-epoxidase